MMSNVILLTPAFLLRMVLASSCSFWVLMVRSGSAADVDHVQREQLEAVVDGDRVVQRPAVGRAGVQDLVEREGDRAGRAFDVGQAGIEHLDRKSTRLNSSHLGISYAV